MAGLAALSDRRDKTGTVEDIPPSIHVLADIPFPFVTTGGMPSFSSVIDGHSCVENSSSAQLRCFVDYDQHGAPPAWRWSDKGRPAEHVSAVTPHFFRDKCEAHTTTVIPTKRPQSRLPRLDVVQQACLRV